MKHNQRGFSLLELMIAMAILSILVSLAVPAYSSYLQRSQVVETLKIVAIAKANVEEYYMHSGRGPLLLANAGMNPDATETSGKFVNSVYISSGTVIATLGAVGTHQSLIGRQVAFVPFETPNGTIIWRCGLADDPPNTVVMGTAVGFPATAAATNIDAEFLPQSCRPS